MKFDNLPTFGRRKMGIYILVQLDIKYGNSPVNIIETGTIRNEDPIYMKGDGHLTKAWAWYVQKKGGRVWTVDIDSTALETCKKVTKQWEGYIEYVQEDSKKFLKEFNKPIHLLYLDSYDSDWANPDIIKAACEHQLVEVENAIDKLDSKAMILLDDVRKDMKGGKSEYSMKYLLENGWKILRFEPDDGYGNGQLLFERI
jgi:hypothetical protein